MDFFALQDRFWQLELEQPFSPTETKLYFYFLNRFNAARWPAVLRRFVRQVAADLTLDEKTATKAVAGLQARGLLTYEAGTRSQSASWALADDRNNSAPKAPQTSRDDRNNSGSKGVVEPRTSRDDRNNSGPYKEEEENVKEENKTKGVGEAAEKITPAPLPAKKEVSAPRCEAPPQNRGSVELPEAVATEAKQLATTIGQLWKISEITNYTKWARIAAFTKRLAQLGQLAQVTQQFAGYKLQREKAGLRPHSLDTWLGTYAEDFANGEWCGCDWAAVAADTRTRPGEAVTTAAPARAATSPTKARNQSWN